jgi:TonB-dependent receptor
MNKKSSFKNTTVAFAIISVAASFSCVVLAQTEIQEEAVSSISTSLNKSVETKRNSVGVVDAINAEGVGKFPDTNIAEAIQRVAGVSIDRVDNEGSKVTARGIYPGGNLVTLNDRPMAQVTNDNSFDFANMSSDLVNSVSVTKTSSALTSSGGVGASINMRNARPLDFAEQKIVFSAKGIDDSSTQNENVSPGFFGLYSNTFADNSIGVLIGASYEERNSGERVAGVEGGWVSANSAVDPFVRQNNLDIPPKTVPIKSVGLVTDIYSLPRSIRYSFNETKQTRTNGQLVLQWQPTDSIKTTLDIDVYEREVDRLQNYIFSPFSIPNYRFPFSAYNFAEAQAVWSKGPIFSPLIYSESDSELYLRMGSGMYAERNRGNTTGLNLSWDLSDQFKMTLDASSSNAKTTPNNDIASVANIESIAFANTLENIPGVLNVSTPIGTSSAADFTKKIPGLIIGNIDALKPSGMQFYNSWFSNNINKSDVDQLRAVGHYLFNDTNSIDVGVQTTEKNNRRKISTAQFYNQLVDVWGYTGDIGVLESVYQGTEQTIVDKFDGSFGDFSKADQLVGGATLGDGNTLTANNQVNLLFAPNFFTLRDAVEKNYNSASRVEVQQLRGEPVGNCGQGPSLFCAPSELDKGKDIVVDEKTQAIFAQYNVNSEISNLPYDLHLGLRYESTKVTYQSLQPAASTATWIEDSITRVVNVRVANRVSEEKFTNLLPNLDARLSLTENVALRFSASKTLGRLSFEELTNFLFYRNFIDDESIYYDSGSSKSLSLKPMESKNNDLSLDWYIDSGSYASLGYFQKKINTSKFVNSIKQSSSKEFKLNGIEGTVQYKFKDSGFGTIVNVTLLNSEPEYNNALLDDQQALVGVGDSRNIIGFYENYGINARVAYSWRDEFLASRFNEYGPAPTYTEAYGQYDVSLSYELMKSLQIFLQGINVTDEASRQYVREKHATLNYTENGARWIVGATYSF